MDFLIIEDEPIILKGISLLIKEYDYPNHEKPTIHVAHDGDEANQRLQTQSFDFVFTDIKMPKMDGLELIEKWSSEKSNVQWVIISGFNDFEFAQTALKQGVKDYLLKPVTRKKMNNAMERLLENRREFMESIVTITQSQNIIEELEESMWMLDEDKITQQFTEWTYQLPYQSIDNLHYKKTLQEILLFIIKRFQKKGVQEIKKTSITVVGHTKEELEQSFIESCTNIIQVIRAKRKGNIIDPIDAAKEYIQSNMGEKLHLTDVAEKLGFNPTYFSQLFKKETGESFVSFRRKSRLEWAKQLIEQDEKRIIDIANEIGYGDLAHFTKSFKKHTGFTPTDYKQQLGITS